MSLINAPAYDPSRDNLKRNIAIAVGVVLLLSILLGLGGYIAGHGWFFSNKLAERKIDHFLSALEAKDYAKAYGIYYNDSDWQQHPQKYSNYPLDRFTEDWTSFSPVKAPITSHNIYISKTTGTGMFGTGVIVAAQLNNSYKCAFLDVNRADGSILYPAPYEIGYEKCHNTE